MNRYYDELKKFQKKVVRYAESIFKVYGNELLLRLEDYNLLKNKKNVIESSTATGFIIEEFLVSKLETFTKGNRLPGEYEIARHSSSTTTSSYDCWAELNNGIKALINVKVQKATNNAIAAIGELYSDYVKTDRQKEKCFLVLKVHYRFDESMKDGQRKIFIMKVEAFFLEEVDFSNGHKQDHRNWSKEFKVTSGRLQVSDKFRKDNIVAEEEVSYENTVGFIEEMMDEKY